MQPKDKKIKKSGRKSKQNSEEKKDKAPGHYIKDIWKHAKPKLKLDLENPPDLTSISHLNCLLFDEPFEALTPKDEEILKFMNERESSANYTPNYRSNLKSFLESCTDHDDLNIQNLFKDAKEKYEKLINQIVPQIDIQDCYIEKLNNNVIVIVVRCIKYFNDFISKKFKKMIKAGSTPPRKKSSRRKKPSPNREQHFNQEEEKKNENDKYPDFDGDPRQRKKLKKSPLQPNDDQEFLYPENSNNSILSEINMQKSSHEAFSPSSLFNGDTKLLGFLDSSSLNAVIPKSPKCVFLIGQKGTGKSTLGNKILNFSGSEKFQEGEGADPVTTEPTSKIGIWHQTDTKVKVVDTPGFNDPKGLDTKNIEPLILFILPELKSGIHMIFIVVNGEDLIFKQSLKENIQFYKNLCNTREFWEHIAVVIMDWGEAVEIDRNKKIQTFREKLDQLSEKHEIPFYVVNGKRKDNSDAETDQQLRLLYAKLVEISTRGKCLILK